MIEGVSKKIGIVDVGGGTRGIYGAGILDWCMDHGISFDYGIGVSAGSANLVSFQAGQRGRNVRFYDDYAFRKDYMSFRNLVRDGSYVDLKYIYGTLSNAGGEDPVDYEAFMANPADLDIVATDARTGKATYFNKKDIQKDRYEFLMASSCVPVACRPWPVGKRVYYDGGISDPIPFRRAFDAGCEKVVVILTRPKDGAEILFAQHIDAAFCLNGFENQRGRLFSTGMIVVQKGLHVFDGIQFREHVRSGNMGAVVKGNAGSLTVGTVGGERHRTEGHAVERAHQRPDIAAAFGLAGELQRGFDTVGAGRAREQDLVVQSARL